MPRDQSGQTYRTKDGRWGVRYYDHGVRRRKSGFTSESKAKPWLERVEKPRMLGETPVVEPLTLDEFCDRYLERYAAIRSPVTVQTLK
jgi:hypothetical protein